jgi:hypothetical protein
MFVHILKLMFGLLFLFVVQAELGMSSEETRKVLLRFPRLPTYNLDKTIRSRVAHLENFLRPTSQGESDDRHYDSTTQIDLDEAANEDIERSECSSSSNSSESDDRRSLVSVLCRCPGLLAVPLETKIIELNDTLGFSGDLLRKAVVGQAALLTYSVSKNLAPKVMLLRSVKTVCFAAVC